MSSIINLSVQQLRQAAALKEKIQSMEKELGKLLGSVVAAVASPAPKQKKFTMSAAAKAKISAAAKARWAKIKGKTAAAAPAPKKAKGKMSAATKAKLSAKLKAIWAKRRAAKK
jgi:peptidoglycan hydrolase CwlO-like protein